MIDLDAAEECALAMAQAAIDKAIRESGITRRAVATEMDRAPAFLRKIMAGDHDLTVKTLARAVAACGFEIRFGVERRDLATAESPGPLPAVPSLYVWKCPVCHRKWRDRDTKTVQAQNGPAKACGDCGTYLAPTEPSISALAAWPSGRT